MHSAPPTNITLSVGENSVNLSWVAKKRHRNVGFQIHYLNKNGKKSTLIYAKLCKHSWEQVHKQIPCCFSADGSKWRKTERVNTSQSFYQLQGLTPGSHYHLRFTYSNSTFWETDIETEGTGTACVLPSFIFSSFIFSAPSSGLPTSKYKSLIPQSVLQFSPLHVKCFQRLL